MIRQENIQIQSPTREFKKLYKPLGNRYLRGLDSYLYHKDLPPISEAQRLVAKGINPLGVRPVNVALPLPANASPAQIQEWIIRTQAYSNPKNHMYFSLPLLKECSYLKTNHRLKKLNLQKVNFQTISLMQSTKNS